MILLKDQTAVELHAALRDVGVTERLARKLQSDVLRKNATEIPAAVPEVSPRVLAAVRERVSIPQLKLLDKVVSPRDSFAKYLFQGEGAEPFEAVRIPLLHR